MKQLDYIIEQSLKRLLEQDPAAAGGAKKKETDNAPSDADISPFTPAEEKFLGKFDAYGTTHLGIIYSSSDIGIREFMNRSGNDLNLTPGILLNLIRNKIIKIVPYTGFGRNTDYTLELQLSLDDVKGLGKDDKEKAEAGSSASGAASGGGAAPPAPEVAWVVKNGNVINESKLIKEQLKILLEDTTNSAAKRYITEKYPQTQSQVDFATKFWNTMLVKVNLSGWNWDETEFIEAIKMLYSGKGPSDGRTNAIIVDSLGKILQMAYDDEDPAAVQFLTDFVDTDYETDLPNPSKNLLVYMSPSLSAKDGIFQGDIIRYIIDNLSADKLKLFKDLLNRHGIGKLITDIDTKNKQIFFATYGTTEVMSYVNKWLDPYKSKKSTDTAGHTKVNVKKSSSVYDTLTKEQRQARAKYARQQINKQIKTKSKNKPKNIDLPETINEVNWYKGDWVDKNGYGYVHFEPEQNRSIRIYPDGKAVKVNKKTGQILQTGKWILNWITSIQEWHIQIV